MPRRCLPLVTALRRIAPAVCLGAALAWPFFVEPADAGWEEGEAAYLDGDYAVAFREWLPLAEAGRAEAQLFLGFMYNDGLGVAKDEGAAVEWFRRAAEQGLPEAQSALGTAYLGGVGVSRDYAQAEKWSRRAAEQGEPGGQFNLGYMYAYGLGLALDYQEAARWFTRGAAQGDPLSQFNLALLYAEGLGVSQSDVEAFKWLVLALRAAEAPEGEVSSMVPTALRLRELLLEQMTAEERAEAERLAREFRPTPDSPPAAPEPAPAP